VTDQPGRPEAQDAAPLDQLSLVNANIPVPVNTEVTANVQSDGSITGPHRIVRV
jgi:hypothetical protein